MKNTTIMLEFNTIIEMLKENTLSDRAKQKFDALTPYINESKLMARLKETSEARKIIDAAGTPPLAVMKEMPDIMESVRKGEMLLPEQLEQIAQFASSSKRLKDFLDRCKYLEVGIAYYSDTIDDLKLLRGEIENSVRSGNVDDNASKDLRDIRREIESTKQQMKQKLESILKSKKEFLTDSYISNRNGHFVLPVKKEYKSQVTGALIDTSATGSTYFIEPSAILKYQEILGTLEIAQSNEERKILYQLTSLVNDFISEIDVNIEAFESLDFIFAKGKLSYDMKGIEPLINTDRYMNIVKGCHPLLKREYCVPLDFSIGKDIRGVVITGPNTGGKTVALKTVGLLSIMAQSGLHIPCEKAELCMNSQILCDIGDNQSISENLSTFSAHITNVIDILNQLDDESLILMDELGSGTDPAEGMGIAVALLEELKNRDCLFVATTHYPEVKEYAAKAEYLINARMAFDRESLKPLYRLEIGEAGESCAFYIAKRLGMPERILRRAKEETYGYSSNHIKSDLIMGIDFIEAESTKTPSSNLKIQKKVKPKETNKHMNHYAIGDSVIVSPQEKIGIVFEPANDKGEVGVQIQKEKLFISHKRLKLKAAASELYPEDYDFSILFDSVENRKGRKKMEKGYQEDLVLKYNN